MLDDTTPYSGSPDNSQPSNNEKPQITSALDGALFMAARGLPVFPLMPGTKRPSSDFTDYKNKATTDAAQITRWAVHYPGCNFAPCYTGDVFAVDVDTKKNAAGLTGMDTFMEMPCLPATLELRTPRGGVHLLFRSPKPVKGGTDALGHGVDVRSNGMYSLSPGSVILDYTKPHELFANGIPYAVLRGAQIADAPQWLLDRLGEAKETPRADGAHVGELDTPQALARATELAQSLPPAIEGQGGDVQAIRAINRVADEGVSREMCREIMHEHYLPRCSDETETDWFDAKVDSAYSTRQDPIGSKSAAVEFDVLPDDLVWTPPTGAKPSAGPNSTAPAALLSWEYHDPHKPNALINWLIKNVVPRGGLGFLAAQPKMGKTFEAIHLALCVATGKPFHGRKVSKPQGVLYIAAEGGHSIDQRISAARKHSEADFGSGPIPLVVVRYAPADMIGAKFDQFVSEVRAGAADMEARFGVALGLIVFDTFAQAFNVRDENAAHEVSAVTKALVRIAQMTKAAVMVVHHFGKDATKGMRGSNAFIGNADFVLALEKRGELTLSDSRDAPTGLVGCFELRTVEIGRDDDGDPITTCYVQEVTTLDPDIPEQPDDPMLAGSLSKALATAGADRVRRHEVKAVFVPTYRANKNVKEPSAKRAFVRELEKPLRLIKITKAGEETWLSRKTTVGENPSDK